MKILIINYEFPPIGGGAATATYHIARCLVRQGHEVSVLTSCFGNLRGESVEEGIRVIRCVALRKKAFQSNMPEMLSFVLSAFLSLPGLLRNGKTDFMVVFFSLPCGPLGLWGKFLSGTPYLVSLRSGDVPGNELFLDRIHKIFKPLRRLILKKSLTVVANSDGLKNLSEKADPFPVKMIPNGVDTDFFTPSPSCSFQIRQNRLLFVGRFREQKNLFFLLDEIKGLIQIGKTFEVHFVGGGPLEYALKQYAKKLEIRNIFWHEWCGKEELRRHYQNAYCMINPSLYEGMPNVVLEAMACGLPVIASNVIGNNTLVRHGETGFLFDLERPEKFREAVIRLLKDQKLACMMGRNGRAWVEKAFSWDNVAEQYVTLKHR